MNTEIGLKIVVNNQTPSESARTRTLLVRPRSVRLHRNMPPIEHNVWPCKIISTTFLGDSLECLVSVENWLLRAVINPEEMHEGETWFVEIPPDKCIICDAG